MGGKHKQSQRIKNNARPSSSGRSAELLASSSQMQPFSAVKEIRFVPPTLSLMKTEEFDSSLSPAFQMVFKKMNKKDCTTKLKALQEFSDLIKSSDVEVVKTILAFWSTLYGTLATDTDHRIREAVHNAHHEIVAKDKKIIAPYLKQLIGPWFTSQYDTYPPAASAASRAFTTAFPPNKIQDCVVFCQKDILTYICGNLTMKIDLNPKHNTPNEDAEAKFERIIVSSLQGYCLFLNTLTEEQIRNSGELNGHIICNSRFLKMATHRASVIRAAWFRVVATLYHKAPFLMGEEHAHLVPLVFNNLDESEPAVVGFVWEAALLIMNLEQDWCKYIHFEKNYLHKLKKVLREGGQGNAAAIYPNLLSFLNKLPATVQSTCFYDKFFENLRMGLKKRSVVSSKSESGAVVTALVECLQYVISTNQETTDLCEKLIKSHLLPLIEWSLSGDHTCYRTVFHQLALLVQHWNRNTTENYAKYLKLFWVSLTNLFESLPCSDDLADRQVVLVQCLRNIANLKEQHKVKFVTDDSKLAHTVPSEGTISVDGTYKTSLTNLVYALLKQYVAYIETHKSQDLLQHVFALIRTFESREFLLGLTKYTDIGDSLIDIHRKLLSSWLNTEELRSEIVIDLTFALLQYVSDVDKQTILTSFLQLLPEREAFGWCVKNAFSHPHNRDPIVQAWIRNPQVGRYLVDITDCNLQNDCPPNLATLFKLAFTENVNSELLVDEATVIEIVKKLEAPLANPKNYAIEIDTCLRLAAFVANIIYTENSLLRYGETLLLALFRFACEDSSQLEFLNSDTLWEINTSWQDVVGVCSKNLPRSEFVCLVKKFADLLEEQFVEKSSTETTIRRLIEAVVSFIQSVVVVRPSMITEVFDLFFKRHFLPDWKDSIVDLCTRAEYLNGNLSRPAWPFKEGDVHAPENITKYFAWSYVQVSVLSSSLQSNYRDDDDDDDGDETEQKEIIYLIDDNKLLVADLLHDLALCQSFVNNYTMSTCYPTIVGFHSSIRDKLKVTVDKLQISDDELRTSFVAKINSADSWFSCKAVYLFHQEIVPERPENIYAFYYKRATTDLSKLYLTQVFGRHLDFDNVQLTATSVLVDVVTLRNLLHCEEIDVQIAEVFETVKKLRSNDIARFLFDNKDLSWNESEVVIETVRLFSNLFRHKFDSLNRQHWDFGVLSLSSWATNACKLKTSYHKEQLQAFVIALTEFYTTICELMSKFKTDAVRKYYVEEWEDLFLPSIHSDLLQLWLYVADQFSSKTTVPLSYYVFLQEFGRVADHFNYKLIFCKDNSSQPSWSKIVKRSTALLVNSVTILQLWGSKMLRCLVPGLVEIDLQSATSNTPNVKGYTVEQFRQILLQTHTIVDGVLVGCRLGEDSCQVTPFTDSYTYVFAYLLLWGILLELCDKSHSELRYQYADWLKNDVYFKSLLNNLFKLMPMEILQYSEGKAKSFSKLFLERPDLGFEVPCTSERIEHMVCWTYASCLSQLPALVRQWWSETDTKLTQIIEKVTAFYVSPQLCTMELLDVGHRENNFKNMTIKIVPSVREVIAIYTVDEAQMELVITLPHNYPLGGLDVRCSRQIGGTQHKQWLMQLKKYLLHQNGGIWDGLSLWNSSLDKKFDGVEECYICFAVLHPGTYQLPKLTCQTCKKKFHSGCLYKWFSTSNKNSCPICRNLF